MAKIQTATNASATEVGAGKPASATVGKGVEATLNSNSNTRELDSKRRSLAAKFKAEPQFTVSVSPFYRPYFGDRMPIIICGVAVYVPVDGRQYSVPESFAMVLNERVARVDKQIRNEKNLADVANNFETYAGAANLISAL